MAVVLLDSTTLGVLTNPANRVEPIQCVAWVKNLTRNNILVGIPGIIDYEHRRKLIHLGNQPALSKLDTLGEYLAYLPIENNDLDKAAELWAWARRTGQQTANDERIDIDVILAAQAITYAEETGEHVVVATDNLGHILRYNVPARRWGEITVEYCQNPQRSQPPVLSRP